MTHFSVDCMGGPSRNHGDGSVNHEFDSYREEVAEDWKSHIRPWKSMNRLFVVQNKNVEALTCDGCVFSKWKAF